MSLEEIQGRLIALVKERIQNGELTERGFARSVGISQAHVHNVLKGVRSLSIKKSDLILQGSHYSILDLFRMDELSSQLAVISDRSIAEHDVPFLADKLGPGRPWRGLVNWSDQHPVPNGVASEGKIVLARLEEDHDMEYTALGYDIAVLEGMEQALEDDGVYAVDRGQDVVLRRVRMGFKTLYLVADSTFDYPARWEPIPLPLPFEVFRGRVRWLGKERTVKTARSA